MYIEHTYSSCSDSSLSLPPQAGTCSELSFLWQLCLCAFQVEFKHFKMYLFALIPHCSSWIKHVFFLHFLTDPSKYEVHQSPRDIIVKDPVDEVQIDCKHSNPDFDMILWYRNTPGHTDMALIGHARFSNLNVEDKFKDKYKVSGSGSSQSPLHVLKPKATTDSAVFFCAASRHSERRKSTTSTKT